MAAFAQDPAAPPAPPADPAAPAAPAAPEPPPPPPAAEPVMAPPVDPAPAPMVTTDVAAAPAAAAESAAPTVKWEGLVDSYYMWNFTGDPSTQGPGLTGGGTIRNFDDRANSFTLNYAKLAAQADFDVVGFRVDFGYGHTGTIINGNSASLSAKGTMEAPDTRAASLYGPAFFVQQAYGTAKLGALTIDAGKFVTTAGAEVIEANKNWLYSRSLLFFGIPLVHTGLRLNLAVSDLISLQGSVVNGWNNDPDNGEAKTFGASITVKPVAETTIVGTTYIGKEVPGGDVRMLFDVVANQTLGEAVGLNLNFDFFKEGDLSWWGLSLMGRFAVNESLYVAARGEYVKSSEGGYASALGDGALYEGTLMVGLPWGKNFELRLEGRGDFSDEEIFLKGAETRKNQITGTAAFLAYF
jgi:hypothetical protein